MRIARYEQEIHDEADRIRERAKNDYRIAAEAEKQAQIAYDRVKAQANAVNSSAMDLAIAREEAESSRKLYEDLLSRSKQAELLTGLKASDISVVEPALLPGKPAKPLVPIYLAASIVLGLILGAGIALCFDLTDSRVVTVSSIGGEFGKSPVGVLPVPSAQDVTELSSSGPAPGLAAFKTPRTPYVEAIQFLAGSLFVPRRGQIAPQVVLVTSPSTAEDRTSLSANMAVLLAQQAKKVLLIDGALFAPKIHDVFKMTNKTGLSTLLATPGTNPMSEVRPVAALPELFVLPAGTTSSSSSGLLSSARLTELIAEYRKVFDVVIVESSPVLAAADSIVLAGHADAVLLISKLGETRTQDLHDSIYKLEGLVSPDSLDLVASGEPGQKVRVYEEGSK
jgi:succinoglycan biosynthesis transport protein ExoP